MFKLLRKLTGVQSLDDILGVFHKARRDLDKFIKEKNDEIEHHEQMKAFHNIQALGLTDARTDAEKVHANLTTLIAAPTTEPATP